MAKNLAANGFFEAKHTVTLTGHEKIEIKSEKELQALLVTPEGQAKLRALAERYEAAGGRVLHASKSVVTYVLIHERGLGLVNG